MTPSENTGSMEGSGSVTPVSSPSVDSSPPVTEKMIPQSQVNRIVGERAREAAERATRDAEARYQSQPQSMGGMPQMSEHQIKELISQESEKKSRELYDQQVRIAQQHQANQAVQDFTSKMNNARSRLSNFDEVFKDVDFGKYADVVGLAIQFGEHTPDIMHDLFSHPNKLSNMIALAGRDPNMALRAMREMQNSISQNSQASNYKSPSEPLRRISPSNAGVDSGDMNKMSVSQLRKSSAFRA